MSRGNTIVCVSRKYQENPRPRYNVLGTLQILLGIRPELQRTLVFPPESSQNPPPGIIVPPHCTVSPEVCTAVSDSLERKNRDRIGFVTGRLVVSSNCHQCKLFFVSLPVSPKCSDSLRKEPVTLT